MAQLALIRHGQSDWNARELWTGWTDVVLTEKGHLEAKQAGELIKNINWDIAFVSDLKRSVETLEDIKDVINNHDIPTFASKALNERDYGNFDGMNKFEVESKYGEDLYKKWHRGWDYPLPHGETLKDVFDRVVPYFLTEILPKLKEGKNVLVSIHGNSIRALVKYLENATDEEIPYLEIATGEIYLYEINHEGQVVSKQILKP